MRGDSGPEGVTRNTRRSPLLAVIQRHGNRGIRKPEPLKDGLDGYWFRRITAEHRLIYKVVDGEVRIAQCWLHYS